jgi:hypothetical protein
MWGMACGCLVGESTPTFLQQSLLQLLDSGLT